MNQVKTTVWDPAVYLETEEQIVAYLDDIFKSGDPDLVITAICDVARAKEMQKKLEDTTQTNSSPFSMDPNPSFQSIMKALSSLGFGLRPAPFS